MSKEICCSSDGLFWRRWGKDTGDTVTSFTSYKAATDAVKSQREMRKVNVSKREKSPFFVSISSQLPPILTASLRHFWVFVLLIWRRRHVPTTFTNLVTSYWTEEKILTHLYTFVGGFLRPNCPTLLSPKSSSSSSSTSSSKMYRSSRLSGWNPSYDRWGDFFLSWRQWTTSEASMTQRIKEERIMTVMALGIPEE